jgi:hypothetical protein
VEGATEEYAERVRPEERTARVKGWRMDCMVAIWLQQHLGAAERSRCEREGWWWRRVYLLRVCEVAARK